MKKYMYFLFLLIVLCGCNNSQEFNPTPATTVGETPNGPESQPPAKIEYVDMSFDAYGGEGSYYVIEFVKNPWQGHLYLNANTIFRFEKIEDRLQLSSVSVYDRDTKKQGPFVALSERSYGGRYTASEYFAQVVMFLSDEDAIRQCFLENGVDEIQKITIINLSSMGDRVGYVIAAITETESYYMTIPLGGAVYGDYIFQKVYTSTEFLEIYRPRPAKVFFEGEEVTFSDPPILGDVVLNMEICAFLDLLGVEYKHDEESETIYSDDFLIELVRVENSESIFVTEIKHEMDDMGSAEYINGKLYGDRLFYMMLSRILGYRIDLHYDDYSLHIYKVSDGMRPGVHFVED